MLDPFQLPFMQRAALEIVLLAPLAGLLGAQIVLRRLAFFTHGAGAAAFPGLVVAGPAGIPPALAALGVGGIFAALLERLGHRERGYGLGTDAATALLLVAALAIGIILASDVFSSGAEVDGLLFGSLLAIGDSELFTAAVVLALTLLATAFARRTWILSGFDADDFAGQGTSADWRERLLLATIALAVVASLDAVGALLVGAVLVVPAATARLFARSVAGLEVGAVMLALTEGIAGLLIAYELDAPPGAAIATLGGCVFLLALIARSLTPASLRRGRAA